MIELRQATQRDIEDYYGRLPLCTMRGVVAVKDGEVLGVGGTYRYRGDTIVFCEMKDHAKKYRKYILKAAKMVLENLREKRVFAICDAEQPTAKQFLEHLGFFCIDEVKNIYVREAD